MPYRVALHNEGAPSRDRVKRVALAVAADVLGLAIASLAVGSLEGPPLGVADASAVYLVLVALAAIWLGTGHAIGVAIASVLLYDFLFLEPRYTFVVNDPREWVNLLLFLFVALVIGRLTAASARRAAESERRAREAGALFRVSRRLALAPSLSDAVPAVLADLAAETRMDRLWLVRSRHTGESVVADTRPEQPRPVARLANSLVRTTDEQPLRWVRAHRPGPERGAPREPSTEARYEVKVETTEAQLGTLVAMRPQAAGAPTGSETRLLALAADQLGLAFRRDDLAAVATETEVVRRSDTLKTALLSSVSHDLRTPLASIRAAAGGLLDPAIPWDAAAGRAAATTIDQEVQRLDRLVRNILDAGRIEAGALRPELEVYDVEDLVRQVLGRSAPELGTARVEVVADAGPSLVMADGVLLDAALTNLVENVGRHAPGAPVRIRIVSTGNAVSVTVEDGGPGVPDDAREHLFDPFYRVPRRGEGARRGMGLGLSVVRGLVQAMGGQVTAGPSLLGGLAVRLELPAAPPPPEELAP